MAIRETYKHFRDQYLKIGSAKLKQDLLDQASVSDDLEHQGYIEDRLDLFGIMDTNQDIFNAIDKAGEHFWVYAEKEFVERYTSVTCVFDNAYQIEILCNIWRDFQKLNTLEVEPPKTSVEDIKKVELLFRFNNGETSICRLSKDQYQQCLDMAKKQLEPSNGIRLRQS